MTDAIEFRIVVASATNENAVETPRRCHVIKPIEFSIVKKRFPKRVGYRTLPRPTNFIGQKIPR